MSYLSRKINRAKWERREGLSAGEIPADAVTRDLKTETNALSFWRCSEPLETEIENTVLALAAAADRLDKIDVTWIDETKFTSRSLTLNQTLGKTPVEGLRNRHVDVANLDLHRLVAVGELIGDALGAKQHKRWTKKKVINLVVEAVRNELVLIDDLKENARVEVEKALKREAAQAK